MNESSNAPVLEVVNLTTLVRIGAEAYPAVRDVSFSVHRQEAVGVVGESGSGKSLLALSIVRLNPSPATVIDAGRVLIRGADVLKATRNELRRIRGKRVGLILQDPRAALNPVWSIGNQITESIRAHRELSRAAAIEDAVASLRLLQVPDPEERIDAYPHELSGGMQQRAVTAAALAARPDVLLADEPTTALDVTVQDALIAQLKELQESLGLGILFVTHDLAVVSKISDRLLVMYAGEIVETGPTVSLLSSPRHPYTWSLIEAVPDVRKRPRRLFSIPGSPPELTARPSGCSFHPRCWLYEELDRPSECREVEPALTMTGQRGVRCHFAREMPQTVSRGDD